MTADTGPKAAEMVRALRAGHMRHRNNQDLVADMIETLAAQLAEADSIIADEFEMTDGGIYRRVDRVGIYPPDALVRQIDRALKRHAER